MSACNYQYYCTCMNAAVYDPHTDILICLGGEGGGRGRGCGKGSKWHLEHANSCTVCAFSLI